jgi:molecular chaperone DnaK (HSP70)
MRYIIGIDLGTTNSAVSYIDTNAKHLFVQTLAIPQFTAPGRIEYLATLPSFCYLRAREEWPTGAFKLPWKEEQTTFVGQFAKDHGARVPTRLVQSAKSWLCNVAADRRDRILPIDAADPSQRLSPVEASAKYLQHIKEAWNATIAKADAASEFEAQEIILTVPASFDEVARSLTVEVARLAGFTHITLLEEPQAAFYSWIAQHEKSWEQGFKEGDAVLVCDVGGGTTDFSLIEVQQKGEKLTFQRMAVGDHLLLGGDNMDVSLAYYIEKKIESQGHPPLDSLQWLQLRAEARTAKERLLGDDSERAYTIVLQGTGASVIKGSLTYTIHKQEVEELLLSGFFGIYNLEEALQLRKAEGFRTMGLPYENEPSVTKQLAHFLQQAHYFQQGKGPSHVLFNGGAMKSFLFQQAITHSLKQWYPNRSLTVLPSHSLDLAVARGAAYYGKVRQGLGVAIEGGLPRNYYLAIDVKQANGEVSRKALTLLTKGAQEGDTFQPEQIFTLLPNTPVVFHLLTSHVRLHDHAGQLVAIDENEMQAMPPIRTVLRFGKRQSHPTVQEPIPVRLGIRLTAVGTLDIWLESQVTEHKWNLEFQIRSASGQDHVLQEEIHQQDEMFDKRELEESQRAIIALFEQEPSSIRPGTIMDHLEEILDKKRREWSSSVLRGLWDPLLKASGYRKRSPELEARWWNLVGFCLRPGFGYPLDDFRIKELWKIILGDLKGNSGVECQIQQWICFRRTAGGLNKGQQMQIASELLPSIFNKKSGKIEVRGKAELYLYSERIRAFASLERIETSLKIRVGEGLLERILKGEALPVDYWALARLGARHLVYGSIGQVISREIVSKWIEKLLSLPVSHSDQLPLVLAHLARKTDHREINVLPELTTRILEQYPDEAIRTILLYQQPLSAGEQEYLFGDRLPSGIFIEI